MTDIDEKMQELSAGSLTLSDLQKSGQPYGLAPEPCPAGQFCPLCGDVGEHIGEKDGHALRQCRGWESTTDDRRMGDVFEHAPVLLSWPWQSIDQYEAQYIDGEKYHVDTQLAGGQKTMQERDQEHMKAAYARVEMLKQFRHVRRNNGLQSTLLDVGCGMGAFIAVAEAAGYSCEGIDVNEAISDAAQAFGRMVSPGGWKAMPTHQKYDIASSFDLVEHLTQPLAFLQRCHDVLNDDGLLVIDTPEWNGDIQGRHVRVTQHICLLSRGALELLLERAGFIIEGFHRPLGGSIGKMCFYVSKRKTSIA